MENTKKAYAAPNVEVIPLDHQISLILSSLPTDPESTWGSRLIKDVHDPFKEQLA